MLNYSSDNYELIEVLGHGIDMVNIWHNHDCPPAVAIELDDDRWEVIILRGCIPTLEEYLRESGVGLRVNAEYNPCKPQITDVRKHGSRVAEFLARRDFARRVGSNISVFVSYFYHYYVHKHI
jgi:hypothetical protein